MGGGEKSGPADEYDALRTQLVAGVRRRPADTRSLTRIAAVLSRIETAQAGRRGSRDLGERVVAAMKGFEDQLLPPDWPPPGAPSAASVVNELPFRSTE